MHMYLCRNAYTLVLHKQGKRLYNTLRDVINDHLLKEVCKRCLYHSHR